jgi:hypothetical protein
VQDAGIDENKIQLWREDTIVVSRREVIPVGKRVVPGGEKSDLFELLNRVDDDVVGTYLCCWCGDKIMIVADCAAFPFFLW